MSTAPATSACTHRPKPTLWPGLMSLRQRRIVLLQEQVENVSSPDVVCVTESGVPCAGFNSCISVSNCLYIGLIRDILLEASVAKNARCPLKPALPFHNESRLTLHLGVAVCLVLTNRMYMKMICTDLAVTFKPQVYHFSTLFLSLARHDAGNGDARGDGPDPRAMASGPGRGGRWPTSPPRAAG